MQGIPTVMSTFVESMWLEGYNVEVPPYLNDLKKTQLHLTMPILGVYVLNMSDRV